MVTFTATAMLADGTEHKASNDGAEVLWEIVDPTSTTATIDENTGVLTAVEGSRGVVTVMVTGVLDIWEGETGTASIEIAAFKLAVDKTVIIPGDTATFTAIGLLADGTEHNASDDGAEVLWEIVDPTSTTATIDEITGVLTAPIDILDGAVTVRATGVSGVWNEEIGYLDIYIGDYITSITGGFFSFAALKSDGSVVA